LTLRLGSGSMVSETADGSEVEPLIFSTENVISNYLKCAPFSEWWRRRNSNPRPSISQ